MPRARSGGRIRLMATALVLAVLAWPAAAAAQGSVEDIASELICLCGCNKLLNVCEMESAQQMKAVIAKKLTEGLDKDAIIAYMTATYGEQVLAAPPKHGFDLTAWITPFALIAVASAGIWLAIAAWVRRRRGEMVEETARVQVGALEARYGRRLERELAEFEE